MKPAPESEFRRIVSVYADRIYNHAFRMLRNREEAEEAVQDIFLKVHRGLPGFRGASDIRTWLYRITVNTCLTRLRTIPPGHAHPDAASSATADAWESIPDRGDGPEELLIGKDTTDLILGAMNRISAEEREILLLFHADELKYEEIARVLDIPVGTVCTRLYRARKKLKSVLTSLQTELRG